MTTTGTESGPVSTVLPSWTPTRVQDYGDVPALGEHTQQVWRWLGLDPEAAAESG